MAKMMSTLNMIYGTAERRKFWVLRGSALLLTLGSIVFIFGAAFLLAVLPALLSEIDGVGASAATLFNWLRFPALGAVMIFALGVLYYVGPNRSGRYRIFSWGALTATVLWVGPFSTVQHLHRNRSGSYNETYGSLGGLVVLLLWLFITAFVVLIGAEVHALTGRDVSDGPRPARWLKRLAPCRSMPECSPDTDQHGGGLTCGYAAVYRPNRFGSMGIGPIGPIGSNGSMGINKPGSMLSLMQLPATRMKPGPQIGTHEPSTNSKPARHSRGGKTTLGTHTPPSRWKPSWHTTGGKTKSGTHTSPTAWKPSRQNGGGTASTLQTPSTRTVPSGHPTNRQSPSMRSYPGRHTTGSGSAGAGSGSAGAGSAGAGSAGCGIGGCRIGVGGLGTGVGGYGVGRLVGGSAALGLTVVG